MYSARGAHTPIDFVCSEVAAFPFASEHSFSNPFETLDPLLSEATSSLWRRLESEAVHWGAFGLDELVAARDSIWFGSQRQGQTLLSTLIRNAAQLVFAGDELPTEQDKRRQWRWLTLAMPSDLLFAVLGKKRPFHPDDLISPFLDRHMADEGYAQVHLHLGAAVEFPHLWVGLQRALADRKGETCLASPGAVFSDGKHFAAWMIRGALVRLIVAAFLRRFQAEMDLSTFLTAVLFPWAAKKTGATGALVSDAIHEVRDGRFRKNPFPFADYELRYVELSRCATRPRPLRLSDVFGMDPIAIDIGYDRAEGASPEVLLIQKSLRYLDGHPNDVLFSRLFWQLVRLRCLFYRHIVQRPLTPGLQWFIRSFGRLKAAREPLLSEAICAESALTIDGHGCGLKSLEVRVSPSESQHRLAKRIQSVSQAVQTACIESKEPIEFGVVLHFTKDRDGFARQGRHLANWRGTEADPSGIPPAKNTTHYRYGRFYQRKRKEARATVNAFRSDPKLLNTVRGLDICTDELGVPNWVMLPLLAAVRRGVSAVIDESTNRKLKRLRTTVHVGEDFVHLMTGLRHIEEAIRFLGFREGDRLGHSLALGIEPREWASRAGRVAISAEEHLFNLAWEYEIAARGGGTELTSRQTHLEQSIAKVGEDIFRRTIVPRDVVELTKKLHDERQLELIGFPSDWHAFHARPSNQDELLWSYLTDEDAFKRGKDIIWVDVAADVDAMTRAQTMVRKEVSQRGLFVEINPSSNLLIGDLGDVTRHPFWRLANPDEANGIPPIAVCIGTDDPITFSTTLRQEYQLVYDALLAGGRSDVEARRWINRIRQNGLEARFTSSRA